MVGRSPRIPSPLLVPSDCLASFSSSVLRKLDRVPWLVQLACCCYFPRLAEPAKEVTKHRFRTQPWLSTGGEFEEAKGVFVIISSFWFYLAPKLCAVAWGSDLLVLHRLPIKF